MMMAHDSNQEPPAGLAKETIASVQAALMRLRAGGGVPSELSDALGVMAREARERQIRPERLLVTLKEIWNDVPEVRRAGGATEQARTLQALVTLTIREYFYPD